MTIVQGLSGPAVWKRRKVTLSASSTQTVDFTIASKVKGLKYIVALWNDANARYRSFEINGLYDGTSVKDTVTHKLRSGNMNINVNIVVNGLNLDLEITNNESFDLELEFAKLELG